MIQHLKNFFLEIKRRYSSIFEDRLVADIQNEYYNDRWISKKDLLKIYEFEKQTLLNEYFSIKQELNDLKSSFNLNALANYRKLEELKQNKLPQNLKPKK